MAILILVRHGKALSNKLGILTDQQDGYPLTDEGRIGVERTAKELGKIKISKLYASDILRAKQTAGIIGKEIGMEPTIDKRLRDRGFGEMLNKPNKDGEWILDVDWGKSAVETTESMTARMAEFLDSISGEKGAIVAVSHEGTIKATVLATIGQGYTGFMFGIRISNAGMTVISVDGKARKLLAVNYPVLPAWLVSEIGSG